MIWLKLLLEILGMQFVFSFEVLDFVFFSNSISDVKNLFRNDIYGSYFFEILFKDNQQNLNTELNKIFTSIIHPARPKDIEKYISQERFLVRETYEMYQKFTKSFIEKQRSNPNHLQWIYNVLELKSEVEKLKFCILLKFSNLIYLF